MEKPLDLNLSDLPDTQSLQLEESPRVDITTKQVPPAKTVCLSGAQDERGVSSREESPPRDSSAWPWTRLKGKVYFLQSGVSLFLDLTTRYDRFGEVKGAKKAISVEVMQKRPGFSGLLPSRSVLCFNGPRDRLARLCTQRALQDDQLSAEGLLDGFKGSKMKRLFQKTGAQARRRNFSSLRRIEED